MKKIMLYILSTISVLSCITLCSGQVYAHDALLDVEYDDCIYDVYGDGIDEMWYSFDVFSSQKHLDHDTITIKYRFDVALDNENPQNIPIDDIKEAYANSMKKWNDVYFYSYSSTGDIVKKKLINIEEGTAADSINLTIYLVNNISSIAMTNCDNKVTIEEGDYPHYHSNDWYMLVNVNHFYVHGNDYTAEYVECIRERTGAHELGHVLGLSDLEYECLAQTNVPHHYELLMGYGDTIENRARDISYKDIAGVAITRGFHTDNDHKWLYKETKDGKHKMICSICNGVKWIDSWNGYTLGVDFYLYDMCNQNHDISDGNMMAVASYGDRDYYKCKYCRYVAPFEDRVAQDYSATLIDNAYHQCENNVSGLEYTFTEQHKANRYFYLNNSSHSGTCLCGKSLTVAHSVRYDTIVDGRYALCLGCRTRLDLTKDNANITYGTSNLRTANGSYVLPNGIVVLVEADLEAYDNGTLQFYNVDDQTQTE